MSALADPYTLRCEAARIVEEGRVPAVDLERFVAEHGDSGSSACPSRGSWLCHRVAGAFAVRLRRLRVWPRVEVPVALRSDGAEAMELFNAAYDSELPMLDELVERAGLGWKCQAKVAGIPCHYMNVGTAVCDGCGATEAQGREEPDG